MKTSSEDEDERRLQDVFIKTNVCWAVIKLFKPLPNEENEHEKSKNILLSITSLQKIANEIERAISKQCNISKSKRNEINPNTDSMTITFSYKEGLTSLTDWIKKMIM